MSSTAMQAFTEKSPSGQLVLRGSGPLALTQNKISNPLDLIMDQDLDKLETDDPYVILASMWPYVEASIFIINMVIHYIREKKVLNPKKYINEILSRPDLVALINSTGIDISKLNYRMAKELSSRNIKTMNDIKTLKRSTVSQQIKNALLFNSIIKFIVFITIALNMWNILHEQASQSVSQMVSYNTNDTTQYIETVMLNAYLQLKVLPLIFKSLTSLTIAFGVKKVERGFRFRLNKSSINMATPVIAGVGSLCASRLLTSYATPEILSTLRFNLLNIVGSIKPHERFTPEQLLKMESASTGMAFIFKSFIGITNSSRGATPINKIIEYQRGLSDFIKKTQKGLLTSLSVIEFAGIIAVGSAVTDLLISIARSCEKQHNIPLKPTPLALENRNRNN